jgi:hypothetical protein
MRQTPEGLTKAVIIPRAIPGHELPKPGEIGAYIREYKDGKACETCASFFSEPLAFPGGWCNKYPSRVCNTGADNLCPKWEARKPDENVIPCLGSGE